MHVLYVGDSVEDWLNYYKSTITDNPQYQLGGDLRGFRAYAPYHRGAGLGNVFKSLFRIALPFLKTMGKHALISGSKIAADVAGGRKFKESAVEHGRTAASQVLHEAADKIQKGKGLGKRKRRTSTKNKKGHAKKFRAFKKKFSVKPVGSDIFGD